MKLHLETTIRDQTTLRKSFCRLTEQVFGFSFEDWYQAGYWTERYRPYTLFDADRAVANVSVNFMEFLLDGEKRRHIQLGTIMTAPEYRGQGFCRKLMETVLSDWEDKTEGIYLFANQSVLDFYPRFQFKRSMEHQFWITLQGEKNSVQKLNLALERDRHLLQHCYQKGNPYSRFSVICNFELLMFYCGDFMKDCVYYFPEQDAVVIMERAQQHLLCYDIFCDLSCDMVTFLKKIVPTEKTEVILGFTPKETAACHRRQVESEDYLFVRNWKNSSFFEEAMMFPLLSHT